MRKDRVCRCADCGPVVCCSCSFEANCDIHREEEREAMIDSAQLNTEQEIEGLWPVIEACYSREWNHFDMPPHYHNRVEIMYVLKGSCLVHLYDYQREADDHIVKARQRKVEKIGPGNFICLDSGVMHKLEVPQTSYMLNVEFHLQKDHHALLSLGLLAAASPHLRSFLERKTTITRGSDEAGILLHLLRQMIEVFSKGNPEDKALQDILTAEFLLQFSKIANMDSPDRIALGYANQAASYLALHLSEDVRVENVANSVGIAPAYLQRLFRKTMGMTLIDYLNKLRIQQSKRLLMNTEDSIMDVGIASGFNSRQHFTRVFRTETQMTPQQFRRMIQSRDAKQVFSFDNVDDHSYDSNWNKTTDNSHIPDLDSKPDQVKNN